MNKELEKTVNIYIKKAIKTYEIKEMKIKLKK